MQKRERCFSLPCVRVLLCGSDHSGGRRRFVARYVYIVGAAPAIFVLFIRLLVKEPERWIEVRESSQAGESWRNARRPSPTTFTSSKTVRPKSAEITLLLRRSVHSPACVVGGDDVDTFGDRESSRRARRTLGRGTRTVTQPTRYVAQRRFAFWLYWGSAARRPDWKTGGVPLLPDRRRDSVTVTFLTTSSITQIFILLPLVGVFTLG